MVARVYVCVSVCVCEGRWDSRCGRSEGGIVTKEKERGARGERMGVECNGKRMKERRRRE